MNSTSCLQTNPPNILQTAIQIALSKVLSNHKNSLEIKHPNLLQTATQMALPKVLSKQKNSVKIEAKMPPKSSHRAYRALRQPSPPFLPLSNLS
jgi:hypothetical protein